MSSRYAGCAIRGGVAGGGRTTIVLSASTLRRASLIGIGVGTIAAGAAGNSPGGFGPLFFDDERVVASRNEPTSALEKNLSAP